MLNIKTRRRVKEHKWSEHSNQSQFFKRIKEQSDQAFSDLTLLAKSLDQEQLEEIFTVEKLELLIKTLLHYKSSVKERIRMTQDQDDRIVELGILFILCSLEPISSHITDNLWKKTYFDEQLLSFKLALLGMQQDIETRKETRSEKD